MESTDVIRSTSEKGVFVFWCPGCQSYHGVWTERPNPVTGAKWTWNGSRSCPTFAPSLAVRDDDKQSFCHFYIRDGRFVFLADCTHSLAGHTVAMATIDKDD